MRAAAQDDVRVAADEFHRLVYSGHVLTEMSNKPELDAVFQTLLEVQPRNPQTDPALLAGILQAALERVRSNAPVYLLATEQHDEILAVYLEAFHQIPAHTNVKSRAWVARFLEETGLPFVCLRQERGVRCNRTEGRRWDAARRHVPGGEVCICVSTNSWLLMAP